MEQLNKIELVGTVGSTFLTDVCDKTCVKFSLLTEYCTRDKNGCAIIEDTWHRVTYWCPKKEDISFIENGACLKVYGRLRQLRYVNSDNVEVNTYEVIASGVSRIK